MSSSWRLQASFTCLPAGLGEVWISQWQAAKLLKPSAIKPVFATIEQNLVLKRLGMLEAADQSALRQGIAAVLG